MNCIICNNPNPLEVVWFRTSDSFSIRYKFKLPICINCYDNVYNFVREQPELEQPELKLDNVITEWINQQLRDKTQ